ncbi:hypothetical protein H7J87_08355 [Mycolicibacterium wolinskyi]|uniref:Uncharacterized protein n=2 Tax=Mycolicibacterium wolinskyi TaxID=59750 RepID=A0A1X2FH54_9MYCO|nr:hypothetical protein [Mycolicibacterium goodii]MCV7285338.1 hypothetical protein [Mycolicibacterium wolinskyi]MCV7295159.1 hypothetical protein [Mycolicibacterium goodii]ORX17727.1 hypothetical protein AWC31_14890 [Mycolicibacterium wolinskyi]
MGHRHAMATAKVMRTAAFTGCGSPHGGVRVRARPRPTGLPRQSHHKSVQSPWRGRYAGQMRTSATAVPGRSPWMNDRVSVLLRLLEEHHGLHVPWELARVQVTCHIDLLSSVFRLNRQAARKHVTDAVLYEIACEIAATVTSE